MNEIYKLKKYYDTKLSINDIHNIQKEYPIHKIILAASCEFFEKLFDHEQKSSYSISLPFDIEIFDILYHKIYLDKIEIQKDIHYYENVLHLMYYLQYRDIKNFMNKLVKYIESNYEENKIDTSSLIENLKKYQSIDKNQISIVERISYDTFIENYYDEKNNRLVLTNHLCLECFGDQTIEINGIKFSTYQTQPCDVNQIGFWINYELEPNFTPMTGKGKVMIYSGVDVYTHHITSYKNSKDRDILIFDKTNGRHGYIKEYVDSIYNKERLNQWITFYKIIIDFI
jgi:hypothetical protein